MFTREIKKGSMELLVLSLLEERARHGYEIGKLIGTRSGGRLTYSLPSLYPALLKLEARGWIKGRWVEKPGERRRCFYRLTGEGRRVLARQKQAWADHVDSIKLVLDGDHRVVSPTLNHQLAGGAFDRLPEEVLERIS